jgi:hypothetical protein
MGKAQRQKGLRGELEIKHLFDANGLGIVGLDGQGDHIVACGDLRLHVETKRHERIRLLEWSRQAEREAKAGAIPVVPWRPSREPWRVSLRLEDFIQILLCVAHSPQKGTDWDRATPRPELPAASVGSLPKPPRESPAQPDQIV